LLTGRFKFKPFNLELKIELTYKIGYNLIKSGF